MRERKRRTRAEMLVRTAILLIAVGVLGTLALFSSLAAWRMYMRMQTASDQAESAKSDLRQLSVQDEQVKSDIDALQSERGVEAALRERYGVARPGEGVIQIAQRPDASASTTSQPQGFFARIFHALWPW